MFCVFPSFAIVFVAFVVSNAEEQFNRDVHCGLPAEAGLCRAYFPMWYYESHEAVCKEFIFGGCGGNLNAFDTQQQCIDACRGSRAEPYPRGNSAVLTVSTQSPPSSDSLNDRCLQPYVQGDCKTHEISLMYFYNHDLRLCQPFMYCSGNGPNQYKTIEECRKTCPKTEENQARVEQPPPVSSSTEQPTPVSSSTEQPPPVNSGNFFGAMARSMDSPALLPKSQTPVRRYQKINRQCGINGTKIVEIKHSIQGCNRLCWNQGPKCVYFMYIKGTCFIMDRCERVSFPQQVAANFFGLNFYSPVYEKRP